MFFGQQNGDNFKTAFEQAAHDLFAFGHEDALPFMLQRPPHGAVRREFRLVKRGDFLNVEHFKDFCVNGLNRKEENLTEQTIFLREFHELTRIQLAGISVIHHKKVSAAGAAYL
jgi:hypothetical protein